jgi:hypothetical protein
MWRGASGWLGACLRTSTTFLVYFLHYDFHPHHELLGLPSFDGSLASWVREQLAHLLLQAPVLRLLGGGLFLAVLCCRLQVAKMKNAAAMLLVCYGHDGLSGRGRRNPVSGLLYKDIRAEVCPSYPPHRKLVELLTQHLFPTVTLRSLTSSVGKSYLAARSCDGPTRLTRSLRRTRSQPKAQSYQGHSRVHFPPSCLPASPSAGHLLTPSTCRTCFMAKYIPYVMSAL